MSTLEENCPVSPWVSGSLISAAAEPRWFKTEDCDDLGSGVDAWSDRHDRMLPTSIHSWMEAKPLYTRNFKNEDLRDQFFRHVRTWKDETSHYSSIAKMLNHPSYLRIIALSGKSREVTKLLLQELKQEPDYWFAALEAVSGERPAPSDSDFEATVDAWIVWGRSRGLI